MFAHPADLIYTLYFNAYADDKTRGKNNRVTCATIRGPTWFTKQANRTQYENRHSSFTTEFYVVNFRLDILFSDVISHERCTNDAGETNSQNSMVAPVL